MRRGGSRRDGCGLPDRPECRGVIGLLCALFSLAVERLESGMRPLFSRGKWICRFHQAGEKRSRSSTRASLSRPASASQLGGKERCPRLTATPFRRNGYPVPAQRPPRSGETASPFRRNGYPVPAQRPPRSDETASPFRRNGYPVPARLDPRLERSRRVKRGGRPHRTPVFNRYLPIL